MTSISIGNSVTSIGSYAFSNCNKITSFSIPNSVTTIRNNAFSGCSGMTSVSIGNSVTSIGSYAFENCSGLNSVHISELEAWCNIAFGNATSTPLYYAHHLYLGEEEIKDLVIPNSVTSIGNGAFMYCSGINTVTIPNTVTSIGNYAFEDCSGLTSINIPNSVTDIGWYTFKNCSALNSIIIPNSVTYIGQEVFYGCTGLTSITIGNGVTWIGYMAFVNCESLTSVHISDLEAWCNISFKDNPLSYAHHLYLGEEEIKDLVIPNSVTSIGNGAFMFCSGLTSVNIPNSVTNIEDYVFYGCSGLTSITISKSVTSLGKGAFNGADISTVISLIENPYAITGKSSFDRVFSENTFNNAMLYVPMGTIDKYKSTDGWKDFKNIVEGVPSAIQNITLDKDINAPVYDLNGRKLKEPSKGINIIGGKKVVVK